MSAALLGIYRLSRSVGALKVLKTLLEGVICHDKRIWRPGPLRIVLLCCVRVQSKQTRLIT